MTTFTKQVDTQLAALTRGQDALQKLVTKIAAHSGPDEFTKQVTTQLEVLTKGQAALQVLAAKVAKSSGGDSTNLAKQVENQLDLLTKGQDALQKLVTMIAQRPRVRKESGTQTPPNVDDAKIAEEIVGGDPDVPAGGNHGDVDTLALLNKLKRLSKSDEVSPELRAEAGTAATKNQLTLAAKSQPFVDAATTPSGALSVEQIANLGSADRARATAGNPATLTLTGTAGPSRSPNPSLGLGSVGGESGSGADPGNGFNEQLIPRTMSGTTSPTFTNPSSGLGANMKPLQKAVLELETVMQKLRKCQADSPVGTVTATETALREQAFVAQRRVQIIAGSR